MQRQQPSMPRHAYYFTASFIMTTFAAINEFADGAPVATEAALVMGAMFAFNAFYELKKENRLHKIFTPLTKQFSSIWHTEAKINAIENDTHDESKKALNP